MRCRVWGCTSCLSLLGETGWTLVFPLPLMHGMVSQEMSEEYQDLMRPVWRCLLLLLPTMSFNCLRRSPADTMLVIFEQTLRAVIVVTQSFRFCGRTVRTSEGRASLRREGLALGSESPLKAKGGVRLSRPVGTDLEDLVMPPTVRGTTLAGEKRS